MASNSRLTINVAGLSADVPTTRFDHLQMGDVFRLADGHRVLMKFFAGRRGEARAVYLHNGGVKDVPSDQRVVRVYGGLSLESEGAVPGQFPYRGRIHPGARSRDGEADDVAPPLYGQPIYVVWDTTQSPYRSGFLVNSMGGDERTSDLSEAAQFTAAGLNELPFEVYRGAGAAAAEKFRYHALRVGG